MNRNTGGSDRRYDEACATHARNWLRRWVDEQGGQAKAARALGVHQGTVSRALDPRSQPSLRVLLELRARTGSSLEEILGLSLQEPIATAPRISTEQLDHIMRVAVGELKRRRKAR